MNIVLNYNTDKDFIFWIIKYVQSEIRIQSKSKAFLSLDNALNSVAEFQSIYKKKYSSREIVLTATYNLVYNLYDNKCVIEINPNVYYAGTHVRLIDLCKLINFGTLNVRGSHIFTDVFDAINKHQKHFYDVYVLER